MDSTIINVILDSQEVVLILNDEGSVTSFIANKEMGVIEKVFLITHNNAVILDSKGSYWLVRNYDTIQLPTGDKKYVTYIANIFS